MSIRVELGLAVCGEGLNPPWLADALHNFEAEAPLQGVNGALADLSRLVAAYAELGDQAEAARVASLLPECAFGLGSRNDRQLHAWTTWFGRAAGDLDQAERRSTAFWLARVLTAASLMTDDRIGGDELPAAIVKASPELALEVFEYMVGNGGISHTDGLGRLLAALIATGNLNSESVQLAAGLASEVIASAGNNAHPALCKELRDRAPEPVLKTLGDALRMNALPTTRSTWIGALFGSGFDQPADDFDDDEDYSALELTDGSKLTRRHVIDSVVDLTTLESLVAAEKSQSRFKWVKVLQRNFSDEPIDRVIRVFENTPHLGNVLVWLAESQFELGNEDYAAAFAEQALSYLPLDSWTSNGEGRRRRAIRILVLTKKRSSIEAARDFVAFISDGNWYSHMLHTDLDDIFDVMSHGVQPVVFWPVIREYLDGYADQLKLPSLRPSPTLRWWVNDNNSAARVRAELNADGVLGELTAVHLTHPSWPVREGIARVIVAALNRRSREVETAISRLISSQPSDDVLEAIASCLAAADSHPGLSEVAPEADQVLREHPNLLVRRLGFRNAELNCIKRNRPLPASYRMQLPAPNLYSDDPVFGKKLPFLFPFEPRYEMFSEIADLELSTIRMVAARYATEALDALPSQDVVTESLKAANMKLANPTNVVLASRSAFGRVLGDLVDADIVGGLSVLGERMLRTGDRGLVGMSRKPRPAVMPLPPQAGHDQTTERWLAEIEDRMGDYVASTFAGGMHLVAAKSSLTVLNWPHVEEEYYCYLTFRDSSAGPERMFSGQLSDLAWKGPIGEASEPYRLLVENEAMTFMERRADWIALHPVLARSLGWVPDLSHIGGWRDGAVFKAGTIDWNDGTWGRSGPMFDDTTSEGFATVMTADALDEVKSLVGPVDLVLELIRRDQRETKPARSVRRRIRL